MIGKEPGFEGSGLPKATSSGWQGTWPGSIGLTAFLLIPEDGVQQQVAPRLGPGPWTLPRRPSGGEGPQT